MMLRTSIGRGDLAPGERIHQERVAAELQVSIGPLREALQRLTREGLVTYSPRLGYFVSEALVQTIEHIYVARHLVEGHAERLAIPRVTDTDLLTMERAHADTVTAMENADAPAMIAANRRLHFVLFDRCDNEWLLRCITELWDALEPYRMIAYRRMWEKDLDGRIPAEIAVEHSRLLEALGRGDDREAQVTLEQHRVRSETFLRCLVEELSGA